MQAQIDAARVVTKEMKKLEKQNAKMEKKKAAAAASEEKKDEE